MQKIRDIVARRAGTRTALIACANDKGVKIAIENRFETCLQGIDTFECVLETITDDNFGLNYDPSHLVHQECNHLLPSAISRGKGFILAARHLAHFC